MKARFHLFVFALLFCVGTVFAQTLNVSGSVVDEEGEPVIGASVLVKGTSKGQSTDLEGKFNFTNLKKSDVLVITFTGMERVEVGVKPKMVVKMSSGEEMLDEFIVTAFGTAKRSSFTGSATVINAEQISKKQVTNVMQGLVGEVPGLSVAPSTSPGSTSSLVIRGKGSINADPTL